MAKIVVYEDSENDAINRYSSLVDRHEVHIRIPGSPMYGLECRRELEEAGFEPELIHGDYGEPGEEIADVYFVDGLGGDCVSILRELPREKSCLYSDDRNIEDRVRGLGFTVADKTVEKMVTEILDR